jgi:hypothetical protein
MVEHVIKIQRKNKGELGSKIILINLDAKLIQNIYISLRYHLVSFLWTL